MLIELAILGGGAALWRKLKRKKAASFSSVVQQTTEKENPFDGKKLVYDLKNAIWGDERQQLQLSLDPDMQVEVERRKKEENRNLVLSAGAMGLTLLGGGVARILPVRQCCGAVFGASYFSERACWKT